MVVLSVLTFMIGTTMTVLSIEELTHAQGKHIHTLIW